MVTKRRVFICILLIIAMVLPVAAEREKVFAEAAAFLQSSDA